MIRLRDPQKRIQDIQEELQDHFLEGFNTGGSDGPGCDSDVPGGGSGGPGGGSTASSTTASSTTGSFKKDCFS